MKQISSNDAVEVTGGTVSGTSTSTATLDPTPIVEYPKYPTNPVEPIDTVQQ
jgi:hypothetical protein